MDKKATTHLARAIRNTGLRAATHVKEPNLSGIVRALDPLAVEISHANLVLEGDEVILSHAVREYDWKYGLQVGDTLLFSTDRLGDYHATSVIAQAKPSLEGMKYPHIAQPGTIGGGPVPFGSGMAPGSPIVGRVPYYDDDGTHVGDIPLMPPQP